MSDVGRDLTEKIIVTLLDLLRKFLFLAR